MRKNLVVRYTALSIQQKATAIMNPTQTPDFNALLAHADQPDQVQTEHVERELLQILDMIYQRSFTIEPYNQLVIFCEQFLQVLMALLLNPHHHFSQLSSYLFCVCKPYLDMMMVTINLQNPPSLHQAIQRLKGQVSADQIMIRHLILLTPTTSASFGEDLGQTLLLEAPLEVSIPAHFGALSQRMFLSEQAEKFKRLIYEAIRFDYASITSAFDFHPKLLSVAGMYISYDHQAEVRHDLRRYFNRLTDAFLKAHEVQPHVVTYVRKERPRLTIISENFHHEHVIFRFYSEQVRTMMDDFEVTLITEPRALTSDKVNNLLENATLLALPSGGEEELVNMISQSQADIVCYLSVGMSYQSKMLSQLRLAPMQVMFLGHPDSTQSPHMDFVICDAHFIQEEHARVEALWSERFLAVKGKHNSSVAFIKNFKTEMIEPHIRSHLDDKVNIAIIGYAVKLNVPYLQFLVDVVNASPKEVIFHFFTNVEGLEYLTVTTEMLARFPKAIVYPPQKLEAYMRCVAECDIAIGTFPFGASNSITDCFATGVPMASLVGIEPHEVTEYFAHCVVGTEKSLCAYTQSDLMAIILRLIEDDDFRVNMSNTVLEHSDRQFEVEDDIHYFSRAIKWAYDHLEEIQDSEQRTYILGPETLD